MPISILLFDIFKQFILSNCFLFYITTFYISHQSDSKLDKKPEHKITTQVIHLNNDKLKYFKRFSQMFSPGTKKKRLIS